MSVTIELEPEIERVLNELEARTGESKADLLRNALRNGVEDLEEYFSAAKALERLKSGLERTYSSEEIRRELGLED